MLSDQWPCPIQCLVANYTPSPLQFQDKKKVDKDHKIVHAFCKDIGHHRRGTRVARKTAPYGRLKIPLQQQFPGAPTLAPAFVAPTLVMLWRTSAPRSASWAPVANMWLFLEEIRPKYFWGCALIVMLYQTSLVLYMLASNVLASRSVFFIPSVVIPSPVHILPCWCLVCHSGPVHSRILAHKTSVFTHLSFCVWRVKAKVFCPSSGLAIHGQRTQLMVPVTRS